MIQLGNVYGIFDNRYAHYYRGERIPDRAVELMCDKTTLRSHIQGAKEASSLPYITDQMRGDILRTIASLLELLDFLDATIQEVLIDSGCGYYSGDIK